MDPAAQMRRAWQLALGRPATDQEVTEAVALLKQLRAADPDAKPIAQPPATLAKLPPADAAALTKICLTIFNLNEFVYVD